MGRDAHGVEVDRDRAAALLAASQPLVHVADEVGRGEVAPDDGFVGHKAG
jgi:hypothetical protein